MNGVSVFQCFGDQRSEVGFQRIAENCIRNTADSALGAADPRTGWLLLYERTDIVLRELPRLHGLNTGHDFVDVQLDGRPVVGGQFENSNFAVRQILLVAKVLVGGDKQIVFILRDPE